MNFALTAVLLIIVLLPGSISLRAYYTSFRVKKSSVDIPVNDLLVKGILISLLIHSTVLFFLKLFGCNVDLELLYKIISGKDLQVSNKNFIDAFLGFGLYNLLINGAAWYVTKKVRRFIQSRNLDLMIYALKSTNYWYHVFSARYAVEVGQEEPDLIVIDALTSNDIIYSGVLVDFNYSPKKDELENIILKFVKKTKNIISKDATIDSAKYESGINGDVLLIPFQNILNLNISYLQINSKFVNTKIDKYAQKELSLN